MSDLIEEIRNLKKNPQLHSFQEYVAVWNALVTLANEAANEIARLRAEVERLKLEVARGFKVEVVDVTNDPAMVAENGRLKAELGDAQLVVSHTKRLLEETVRERDEALALGALFIKDHLKNCSLPQPCHILENVPAQARALLDRLSESEQGSELAQEYGQDHPWPQFTRWHDDFHATSKRPMPCKTPLRCFWRWTRKTGAVLDQTGVMTDRLRRAEAVGEQVNRLKTALCDSTVVLDNVRRAGSLRIAHEGYLSDEFGIVTAHIHQNQATLRGESA